MENQHTLSKQCKLIIEHAVSDGGTPTLVCRGRITLETASQFRSEINTLAPKHKFLTSGVISKAANGSGSELSKVVPDRELSKQGKSGLFPQSFKKKRIQKSGAVLSRGRLWFWSWLFRRRGVGLRLGPPAPRSTFEDVTMV